LLALAAVLGLARDDLHGHKILLQSRVIDTTLHRPSFASLVDNGADENETQVYFLHFGRSLSHDEHVLVQQTLQLPTLMKNYIPHNTFLVDLSPSQLEIAHKLALVAWVGRFESTDKYKVEHFTRRCPVDAQDCCLDIVTTSKLSEDQIQKWILADQNPTYLTNKRAQFCIDVSNVYAIVADIAKNPHVLWISTVAKIELHNKWERSILQLGNYNEMVYVNKSGLIGWDLGLNGEGEIIGMADSGINLDQCFMKDPNSAIPFQEYPTNEEETTSRVPPPSNHRKIVQYVSFGDQEEDASGHGTHIATSIAGKLHQDSIITDLDHFEGMASGAKLAFFDIGTTGGHSFLMVVWIRIF
jgi:subtilisin family serine protease